MSMVLVFLVLFSKENLQSHLGERNETIMYLGISANKVRLTESG